METAEIQGFWMIAYLFFSADQNLSGYHLDSSKLWDRERVPVSGILYIYILIPGIHFPTSGLD